MKEIPDVNITPNISSLFRCYAVSCSLKDVRVRNAAMIY